MNNFSSIPPTTRTIMILSIAVPAISFLIPSAIKYIYYDLSFLPLQFYRLFTAIFLSPLTISHVFSLISRFQILLNIENSNLCFNTNSKYETLFFIFTFAVPLFFANILEKLTTFEECINIALVKLMCSLLPFDTYIPFYGFTVNSSHLPYYYFFLEFLLSKLTSRCYYGLIYASVYIHMRKKGFEIPPFFMKSVDYIEKIINSLSTKLIYNVRNIKITKKVGQKRTNRNFPSEPAKH